MIGTKKTKGDRPLTEEEWNAERRSMETLDTFLVGRRILVMDVSPLEIGELGYTSKGSVIHIAREHDYYRQFTREEAAVFRFGVNVHEALHQVFTDFDAFNAAAEAIANPFEQEMFARIFNLVEDPAIENFADQVVGGFALDALHFTIEKIYEGAQPVSGPQNHGQALEEYLDALIQFGDRGIVKGGFSSDTARRYFNRTAPIIYRAINEPDGAERVRLSMQVYQEAKALWAGQSSGKIKMIFEAVAERYAKNRTAGSGKGKTPQKTEDARNGRRRKEMKAQSLKEDEALMRDAGLMPDDEGNKEGNGEKKAIRKNDGQNQNFSADKVFPEQNPGSPDGADDTSNANDTSGADDTDDGPVFTYDPQIAEKFAEAMKRYLQTGGSGDKTDDSAENPESYSETVRSQHRQFSGIKEKNIIPSADNIPDGVADILNAAAWITAPLVTQLKKIFMDDRGGKVYTQRGRVSMKRAASGRTTTRMFERRILPGDKADMCLMLLLDLSGSMQGNKELQAKLAATVLCEAFAALKIPVYCMGFQHIHGFDAYQTHFVRWKNTTEERLSILSAVPGGNNFDSYSIRYATEVLRKRTEKHKLMCVISDGLPSHYFTGEDGIRENTAAIQDARTSGAEVFGIAVGAGSTGTFTRMYGEDHFISILQPNDLADQAADLIRTVVKGW